MIRSVISFFKSLNRATPYEMIKKNDKAGLTARLLDGSLHPNATLNEGSNWTYLHFSLEIKQFEIFTLLLQHGADPNFNLHKKYYFTILNDAFISGNQRATMKLLLTYGASYEHIKRKHPIPNDEPLSWYDESLVWLHSIAKNCYAIHQLQKTGHQLMANNSFVSAEHYFLEAAELLEQFAEQEQRILNDPTQEHPAYKPQLAFVNDYRLRAERCRELATQCDKKINEKAEEQQALLSSSSPAFKLKTH